MAIDNKELKIAEEEANEEKGFLYTHTFRKPVLYNGESISSLTFDFDKLTGEDALNIENELTSIGKMSIVPAFSGEYLIRMAAKACDKPIGEDFFRKAPIADYNKIRSKARSFLLASES